MPSPLWLAHNMSSCSENMLNKPGLEDERNGEWMEQEKLGDRKGRRSDKLSETFMAESTW